MNFYSLLVLFCQQIKLMPLGVDNLVLLPDETRKRVYDAARRPPEGHVLDKDKEVTSPTVADRKEKRWRVGGTEFEALMRMLDNAVSIVSFLRICAMSMNRYEKCKGQKKSGIFEIEFFGNILECGVVFYRVSEQATSTEILW